MTVLSTAFERRFMSFAFLQNRATLVFEAIGGDRVRRPGRRSGSPNRFGQNAVYDAFRTAGGVVRLDFRGMKR